MMLDLFGSLIEMRKWGKIHHYDDKNHVKFGGRVFHIWIMTRNTWTSPGTRFSSITL